MILRHRSIRIGCRRGRIQRDAGSGCGKSESSSWEFHLLWSTELVSSPFEKSFARSERVGRGESLDGPRIESSTRVRATPGHSTMSGKARHTRRSSRASAGKFTWRISSATCAWRGHRSGPQSRRLPHADRDRRGVRRPRSEQGAGLWGSKPFAPRNVRTSKPKNLGHAACRPDNGWFVSSLLFSHLPISDCHSSVGFSRRSLLVPQPRLGEQRFRQVQKPPFQQQPLERFSGRGLLKR